MGVESVMMSPTAADYSSSSGASTATTESGVGQLPVATSQPAAAAQGSSRFKGVVPQPNGRWGAQIYERHARVWLGTFPDEEAAARAYDVAALRYRGREAATNFRRTRAHPRKSSSPAPTLREAAVAERELVWSSSPSTTRTPRPLVSRPSASCSSSGSCPPATAMTCTSRSGHRIWPAWPRFSVDGRHGSGATRERNGEKKK